MWDTTSSIESTRSYLRYSVGASPPSQFLGLQERNVCAAMFSSAHVNDSQPASSLLPG